MLRQMMMTAALAALVGSAATAETIRYATARDIYGLDPDAVSDSFTNIFTQHIYEPLVRYNAQMEVEPALATSWEVISPTQVRYHLREGVKFQQGQDFDAEDVKVSLLRAIDPHSPLRGNLPDLKDVKVIDAHTVDLILDGPSPILNNYLTNISIMDSGWLAEHNATKPIDAGRGEEAYTTNHANGTGPFVLESRRPDAKNVLVQNKGWWDKPQHNITKIIHTPIASDATRVAALLSGEVDLIEPAPLQDAKRIEAAPGAHMLENPGLRTIMMGFNQGPKLVDGDVDGNPLRDMRVRQAIYQAIDMDLIRDRIMRGKSRVSGSLIASEVNGFAPEMNKRLPFDPKNAEKLLAEAGYAKGFSFNLNCPNDRYVNDADICQAMAAMLAKVGLRPHLVTEPRQIHFQKVDTHQVDMYMLGWATLPMLDGFSVLSAMLATPEGAYGTYTPQGYSNPKLDALTKAVAEEMDPDKRRDMMVQAFMLEKKDIAWLPLHQQPLSWAANNKVDIPQAADGLVRLWYAHVKP
ncbi:ABC transporter substrate-binding protein [Aquicoccus sp. G2-2]|uniref:ABC transporter substrate-binding protein n=1 Tax=Aquicoccus sp. G2-2 TaxID=3092120 RepID=UPI002AE0A1C8|nr:ABC transporter substrate-binding protein [Aquicoccus sp. G2-2]MEA1114780.1 ABC transporter substrate-binding protein [Aquicoccus sp. G2-2]